MSAILLTLIGLSLAFGLNFSQNAKDNELIKQQSHIVSVAVPEPSNVLVVTLIIALYLQSRCRK